MLKAFCYISLFLQISFVGIAADIAQPISKLEKSHDVINMVYFREGAAKMLSDSVSEFEKQSGYPVNLVFVSVNELKPTLIKAALDGSLPDVVLVPSDFISLASSVRLSTIPTELLGNDLTPEALASVSFQHKILGVPVMGGNHLVLYYNKKYVSHPARNWQQLKMQAAELRQKGVEPIGWNYLEMYWFTSFAGTFGGTPVTDGKLTLNTPAYAAALEYYKELSDSGLISAACDYDCAFKDFIEQRFAYVINGEWAYQTFKAELGDDLGVAVIPAIGNKPFRPLFSTVALVFPDQALSGPKGSALSLLAEFFQHSDYQDRAFSELAFLPVNQDSFAEVKNTANANVKQLLKQLSQALPMPPDPVMANAWAGMRKGFDRYMAGISTATDAAAYMQTFAERDYQKTQMAK